jgi:dephospho-CoA kinase
MPNVIAWRARRSQIVRRPARLRRAIAVPTARMSRPVIGLTGGIGSGKSTVAAMLAELGADVIDTDKVGHEVYRPGTEGFRQVTAAFGADVVAPDGGIDRRRLAAKVFADPGALQRLNAIVHPLIGLAVREWLLRAQAEPRTTPIVVEAPVLMEAGWRFFDEVWVVVVEPETAVARVTGSRSVTADEVHRRLAAQMSNDERVRLADRVIRNDGDLAALRAQVEAAWRAISV